MDVLKPAGVPHDTLCGIRWTLVDGDGVHRDRDGRCIPPSHHFSCDSTAVCPFLLVSLLAACVWTHPTCTPPTHPSSSSPAIPYHIPAVSPARVPATAGHQDQGRPGLPGGGPGHHRCRHHPRNTVPRKVAGRQRGCSVSARISVSCCIRRFDAVMTCLPADRKPLQCHQLLARSVSPLCFFCLRAAAEARPARRRDGGLLPVRRPRGRVRGGRHRLLPVSLRCGSEPGEGRYYHYHNRCICMSPVSLFAVLRLAIGR